MTKPDQEIPNSYLLEEIREVRKSVERYGERLTGKVGRAELFGWISAVSILVSMALILGG